eukprot:scaffold907_cov398-Prasinococcus_capsulatus_cf.AAC.12
MRSGVHGGVSRWAVCVSLREPAAWPGTTAARQTRRHGAMRAPRLPSPLPTPHEPALHRVGSAAAGLASAQLYDASTPDRATMPRQPGGDRLPILQPRWGRIPWAIAGHPRGGPTPMGRAQLPSRALRSVSEQTPTSCGNWHVSERAARAGARGRVHRSIRQKNGGSCTAGESRKESTMDNAIGRSS